MDKPNLLYGSLAWATNQQRQQALLSQLGQESCAHPTGKTYCLLHILQLLTWGMYMTDQNCPLRKPSRE